MEAYDELEVAGGDQTMKVFGVIESKMVLRVEEGWEVKEISMSNF